MASTSDASKPARAVQDTWKPPKPSAAEPTLKVYNSLTRTKSLLCVNSSAAARADRASFQVDFVPSKPGVVTWYNCGPTVYDSSHMGHARNYMAQDIMRRILRDYFGYEVNFVMNITDVDDKIIVRARQSHLLTQYVSELASSSAPLSSRVLQEVSTAWTAYFFKTLGAALPSPPTADTYESAKAGWTQIEAAAKDAQWVEVQKLRDEKFTMYLASVRAGHEGLLVAEKAVAAGATSMEEAKALVEANRDAVGLWLDKQFGATVTDPAVFRDLAAFWEESFFNSMSALHVERPTTLTRVSEYIPEIVKFVEGIVDRGFAYEGGGSVWFDTVKFEGAEGAAEEGDEEWRHTYAKLQPWSKGNRELLEDGEGSLTSTTGKRSAADFALWKSSKPGEPAWNSNWGPGRPGWHIECSVMASAVLGSGMDVHSGGVDLAFPHHDNEIAQSEASLFYAPLPSWRSTTADNGSTTSSTPGLKMSKSLKNFITIDDALQKHSARQIRFAFLRQTWSAGFDFKESAMQEVRSAETLLNNFFAIVKALVSEARERSTASDGSHHYEQAEKELMAKLEDAQLAFRVALCDSFDTPKALQVLLDLVSTSNIYLARGRQNVNVGVLSAVSEWITRMLRMFGLGEGSPTDAAGERVIGWGTAAAAGEQDQGFDVRKLAMEGAPSSDILALTDRLRDSDLVDLGVALDDQEDGRAMVKLKRLERLERGRTAPSDMFRGASHAAEYSEWDEHGVPTKDKEGVELPKSRVKKLKKEWDQQKKLHDEFLKEQQKQEVQ
ncbi:SPOSA6832_05090, partial [Sporobolomyces salmonicolor]